MKKRILLLLASFLLITTTGCQSNKPDSISSPEQQPPLSNQPRLTREDLISLNQFENIVSLHYADDTKIAVLTDKLSLYDLSTHMIVAETEIDDGWNEDINFISIDDGYVVVGTNRTYEIECTFYDKNLNHQNTFNLAKELKVEPVFVREVAISNSGNFIAISDMSNGLFLYNRKSQNLSRLLSMDETEILSSLTHLAFCDGDQTIAFLGIRINESGYSESVLGSVNIKGEPLHTKKGKELESLIPYDSFVIFGQDIPDQSPSKEAWIYTPKSQDLTKFALMEAEESTNIWGSQSGDYFCTSVYKKGKGWLIRVYDTAKGTMLHEELYACDTSLYHTPYMYIPSNATAVALYLRPSQDNSSYKIDALDFK